jgi:hypothetical protein
MATRSGSNSIPYWGSYLNAGVLPNCAGAPQQTSALEVGDQAYVPGTNTPYVCTDATQGAAVWVPVAVGQVPGDNNPPPVYVPPAVTNSNFGGVADGLLAPIATGSGGTYPTGFVGGETFPITIEGKFYNIVFAAGDQSLAQVVARINTTVGGNTPYASASGGELKFTATTLGSVITIWDGTALATLGFALGSHYGAINPAATDNWAAFQNAIYASAGATLTIPGGAYRIAAPLGSDIGLYINQALRIVGAGNIINGTAQLLFDNANKDADFIVIEGSGARGTMLESITFRSYHNAGDGRHGIVVHAPFVTLERIATPGFGGANSYAVIQESGTVGVGIQAATLLPAGYYIGSNFLTLYQPDIEYVGDPATGTGGGFFTHGSDSKSAIFDMYALACGTAVVDSSLIGTTINGFHDEVCYSALYSDAAGGTRLFACMTEAFHPPTWVSAFGVSFVGSLQAPTYHFGVQSKLFRSRRTTGLITYESEGVVPDFDMSFIWWRNDEQFGTGFGSKPDTQGNDVFAWMPEPNNNIPNLGPFATGWGIGVTDPLNPRGPCLPIVGRAWLNGRRQWKERQVSVTLVPGLNVVQLAVDYAAASPLGAGDRDLPGVDTHVWCTVELHEPAPDVTQPFPGGAGAANTQATTRNAALVAAPMRVGGTVLLWQDSVKGNWAVQLTNETVGDIVVDVIWSFEQWQTSGAASGP